MYDWSEQYGYSGCELQAMRHSEYVLASTVLSLELPLFLNMTILTDDHLCAKQGYQPPSPGGFENGTQPACCCMSATAGIMFCVLC